jgi:protein phosphatase
MSAPGSAAEITLISHKAHGRGPQAFVVNTYGLTDPGRVRASNEDSFLISELRKAMRVAQTNLSQPTTHYSAEQGHLFLVADGMGGHNAGELASALAVGTVEEFALNTFKWFFHMDNPEGKALRDELRNALRLADARVCEEAANNPELHGMGTTMTLAYALNADLYVVHVGDSRCYVFRERALHRITQDHTLVAELVRRGELTPEQAATHRWRHVVTNTVGGTEPGVHAEVHKVQLEDGDVVLLCSDGLTEMVSDEWIAEVLEAEPDPRRACERLVAGANERGGRDNVTVIVARFDAVADERKGMPTAPREVETWLARGHA